MRDGSRDAAGCLVCGAACPSVRARYCSHACQQQAYRARHHRPSTAVTTARQQLQRQRRLVAHTVYICPRCDERYLGERRCPECHVFCRAAGLGGRCPDCDTVLLLADLLDLEVTP
jgi:hypothetical protein